MTERTLFLMRHAHAEDFAPGCTDAQRPLSEQGRAQARAASDYLRSRGIAVDAVLASAATRAQETAAEMALADTITAPAIYNAAGETIAAAMSENLADEVRTAVVIGHAPGIPALMYSLLDGAATDHEALDQVGRGFPTATLIELTVSGPWSDLVPGPLRSVWRP